MMEKIPQLQPSDLILLLGITVLVGPAVQVEVFRNRKLEFGYFFGLSP